MRLLRRVLLALGLVGLAAALAGLRGRGGRPPAGTGWRELEIAVPESDAGDQA